MKLTTTADLTLPDGIDGPVGAGACLVSAAGVFHAVAWWDGGVRYAVVSIAGEVVLAAVLDDLGDATVADHAPAPVLLDDDSLGLVVDAATLRVYDDDLRVRHQIAVGGGDVLDRFAVHGQRPRVTACASRGRFAGAHVVVLDEPVATGNPRYLASLRIDGTGASWTGIRTLGPDGFPVDRFGDDGLNDSPDTTPVEGCVVGDAVGCGDSLLVCVEGSDASSVPRYGADFFTVTRVAADGTPTVPLYEQSGWKRQPGKHGIRGKVTSSGRYVVLTPVFATGEWKGRQRLLDLRTGEVLAPVLPRGTTRMRIVDHGGATFWLSDGAQRIVCAEVSDAHAADAARDVT